MRSVLFSTCVLFWMALPASIACSYPRPPEGTGSSARELRHAIIMERDVQAGGKCGIQGGNAVCAAGLCCSEEGTCGIGGEFCVSPGCQFNFGPACDGNAWPSGRDTSDVPRPVFGDLPFGAVISRCTVPGKVAMTFDDGPKQFTKELLDILKANNAKATFFITATNGGKGQIQVESTGFPAIIKRMHAEGHQIGSHSWSHQNFTTITPQQRRDQIVKNEMALVDILGFFPTYMRLPYSSWNDEVLADLGKFGYHVINYNLDTHDSEDLKGDYRLPEESFVAAVSQHSPADWSFIAVAHDIQERTVRGYVQFMIDQARKYKYELVTVGECLADPSNNWYRDPTAGGKQFGGPPPTTTRSQVAVSPSGSDGATATATTIAPTPGSSSSGGGGGNGNGSLSSGHSGHSGPTSFSPAGGATETKKADSAGRRVFCSVGAAMGTAVTAGLWVMGGL